MRWHPDIQRIAGLYVNRAFDLPDDAEVPPVSSFFRLDCRPRFNSVHCSTSPYMLAMVTLEIGAGRLRNPRIALLRCLSSNAVLGEF